MKKNGQNTSLINIDNALNKDFKVEKIKTTNVNILLNRVKLDQKKTFKKRLIICSLIILTVSLIGSLSII